VPGPKGEPLSVAEWKRLPELPIVRIASEDESASVYTVIRAGFMPAKQADASATGLSGTVAPDVPAGILPLPTATVASGEGERIYRLPIELNDWVISIVALAQDGRLRFPCEVEFGILRGRHFAEFVLAESRTN